MDRQKQTFKEPSFGKRLVEEGEYFHNYKIRPNKS